MKHLLVIGVLFFLTSCKDDVISEEQKAQDILKGTWEISQISDAFWQKVVQGSQGEGLLKITILTKENAIGGTVNFNPCNAKNATPRSPCKSSFEIAGVSGGGFYYNIPGEYLDWAVLVPSAPGTQNYTDQELEVMNVFSGYYGLKQEGPNTLLFTLQRNVYTTTGDASATITLSRK